MCPGKMAQILIAGGCKNGGIGCDYVGWGRIAYVSAELPRCAVGMAGGCEIGVGRVRHLEVRRGCCSGKMWLSGKKLGVRIVNVYDVGGAETWGLVVD